MTATKPAVLSQKSINLLRIASLRGGDGNNWDAWRSAYEEACRKYSEKAVLHKFEELERRQYLDCGVSARTGWLTEKGRSALEAHTA